ncbi:alginate lyase family protein [Desulfosporosinus sp. BICA1-9]|uniref:alginate lyase family protein n=1 Tax=Desulfosporosinus sp. BICA1-9 TaxID=1531958 RepID=UPI00054B01BA|nr:alginate lyase family protein [Desulfosporosinus sp. BICA1-9]KJS49020.1 MAG: hypothetical protein VR66_10750 [Peptococcaceae bacterium BRH_c23]KJS90749.1 MAG: hypothetical protein JL57_00045 [Desulfosporosinus sp. BICA1-9]
MDKKIILYINTIKYLKPSQIFYRVTNRVKRELYKRKLLKVHISNNMKVKVDFGYFIPELDFDMEYLDRFNTKELLNDEFKFINIKNKVELSKAWNNKELQHLWRYNLHYFEYLFKLAFEYSKEDELDCYYEKYKFLIRNWIENNPFPDGDGWHPYTISLRLTTWIATYQIFKNKVISDDNFNSMLKKSMYLQYQYLQNNLEKDVLGNHYFENIKALIIGSIFFEEAKVKNKFIKELLIQLDEQILEDGMHFELSPMYHKIVLEDLIKITVWLKHELIYNQLIAFIQKMIDTTYSFEEGFGKTPAFNDSADGISKNYKCLLKVCEIYFGLTPKFKESYEHSGFYVVKNAAFKLILDNGDICPSFLPAHGHCDALSFELSIENSPVLVNSGTYKYESGKWRNYFRSTMAHNTIAVSNQDQSQYWGSFRIAKRITRTKRKEFIHNNIKFYSGAYTSYHGVDHKRYIGIIDDDKILVLDKIRSELNGNIMSYVHFVPGAKIDVQKKAIGVLVGNKPIQITAIGTKNVDIEKGWYSERFNVKEENRHLILKRKNTSNFFGYLIDLSNNNIEIIESEHEIKIISNQELIINLEELGDML